MMVIAMTMMVYKSDASIEQDYFCQNKTRGRQHWFNDKSDY